MFSAYVRPHKQWNRTKHKSNPEIDSGKSLFHCPLSLKMAKKLSMKARYTKGNVKKHDGRKKSLFEQQQWRRETRQKDRSSRLWPYYKHNENKLAVMSCGVRECMCVCHTTIASRRGYEPVNAKTYALALRNLAIFIVILSSSNRDCETLILTRYHLTKRMQKIQCRLSRQTGMAMHIQMHACAIIRLNEIIVPSMSKRTKFCVAFFADIFSFFQKAEKNIFYFFFWHFTSFCPPSISFPGIVSRLLFCNSSGKCICFVCGVLCPIKP